MKIAVCVGSSCHLKGSYDILQALEKLIKEHNLEEKVTLSASFCLGACAEGVAMTINDNLHLSVNTNNIEEIFLKEIVAKLED